MAQVINTNSLSLITQNNINKNQSALSTSIERLSSGLRINSAKDDAAGQAIANRFTSNIKGLTQAARNANDGISLAQTTEGALSEINNNLQRVRELTVQASTGTNSKSDLSSIQDEIKSRLDEIDRVSAQTQFNGVNVLSKDGKMDIQVGANDGQTISINLKKITSSDLGLDKFSTANIATSYKNDDSLDVTASVKSDLSNVKDTGTGTDTVTATGVVKDSDGNYFVKGDNGKLYTASIDYASNQISFDKDETTPKDATGNETSVTDISTKIDIKGLDAGESLVSYTNADGGKSYAVQTGSGDSATYKAASIAKDGTVTSSVTNLTLTLNVNPLDKLDSAISDIDKFRSSLGAVQNQLTSAVTNLNNTTTNLSEAQSRIQDADYATEVSNMSKAQIIQQAGNSVLSKANQVPQQILSLLQG